MRRAVPAVAAVAAALAGGAPVAAHAQTAGSPPAGGQVGRRGPGGGMRQMLFEGITLTAAQQAKVDSIRGAYRERMMASRGANGGASGGADARPDSAAFAARRQMMNDQRAALRAVLTPDQQRTFDANVTRMEQRRREAGANGWGARRPGSGR